MADNRDARTRKPGRSRWSRIVRHFDGWELGVVAIVIALLGVALAIPWSIEPRELPPPRVDDRAVAATLQADRLRAERTASELEREPARLYDLRALGSSLREFGRAEAENDTASLVAARRRLASAVPAARALGDELVLGLRAFEQDRFLRAVERYTSTGAIDDDLTELGGSFVASARANGWLDSSRRWIMTESVRAILFKKRWNELTGLVGPAFALSLDESKAFYRFVLDHPPRFTEFAGSPLAMCNAADRFRMRKVDELAAIDATYPRALARGVLFARLGDYPAAAESFREQLGGPTAGRYALLARNYLRFAVERASGPDER